MCGRCVGGGGCGGGRGGDIVVGVEVEGMGEVAILTSHTDETGCSLTNVPLGSVTCSKDTVLPENKDKSP